MDNGVQFTNHARNHRDFPHIFDRVCEENGIEHGLTLPAHPWTNGQVKRMNKTIKEATAYQYANRSARASLGLYRREQFRKAIKIPRRSNSMGIHC